MVCADGCYGMWERVGHTGTLVRLLPLSLPQPLLVLSLTPCPLPSECAGLLTGLVVDSGDGVSHAVRRGCIGAGRG